MYTIINNRKKRRKIHKIVNYAFNEGSELYKKEIFLNILDDEHTLHLVADSNH
jgi:hypothetical protein